MLTCPNQRTYMSIYGPETTLKAKNELWKLGGRSAAGGNAVRAKRSVLCWWRTVTHPGWGGGSEKVWGGRGGEGSVQPFHEARQSEVFLPEILFSEQTSMMQFSHFPGLVTPAKGCRDPKALSNFSAGGLDFSALPEARWPTSGSSFTTFLPRSLSWELALRSTREECQKICGLSTTGWRNVSRT